MEEIALLVRPRIKSAKYLGVRSTQDTVNLYTNTFAGNVKLTPAEWKQVQDSVKEYAL